MAAGRLMALPVTQRLVMVVSDGSPMETATQRTNAEYYLDHHLRTVLRQIERSRFSGCDGAGCWLGSQCLLPPLSWLDR